jgi:hypothetical protein
VLVLDNVVEGEEVASALARLFAALVLGLFLADAVGWRARWVAGGGGPSPRPPDIRAPRGGQY